MKRIFAVLLCLGILLLSGCSLIWPDASSNEEERSVSPVRPEYRAEYENKWCYQHLDQRLRECYGAVYTAVKDSFDRDETVDIEDSSNGTSKAYTGLQVNLPEKLMSREEAQLVYTAFTWDNPQFFFIGNTYSYKGYRSGDQDYYDVFCLVYTMNAQERKAASRQLEAEVQELLDGIPEGADEFEKELYLHDRLMAICTYDDEAAANDNPAALYPDAFTAYGALVKGRAVCEGYSRSMQLLLNRAGIRATLVSGYDDKQVAHMWNLVTIDGRNYHLDPTWNDADDLLRHTFFNVTTEEIERTHTLDGENIGVDTCTATEANYYIRTGHYLDTYERVKIAAVIAQEIRQGHGVIDLRFPSKKFYSAKDFISTPSSLFPMVNKALKDDGLSMWEYTVHIREDYQTITIYKK